MNYFLHYDNNCPLFVGGGSHGQKIRVRPEARHWRTCARYEIDCSFELSSRFNSDKVNSLPTWTYREERVYANGRIFRIFVHEVLTSDAAFMLLMSTCADSPALMARVKELEAENICLKKLIALMAG